MPFFHAVHSPGLLRRRPPGAEELKNTLSGFALHWAAPTSGREGLSAELPVSLDFVLPRVPHQDHWLPEDRLLYSFSSLVFSFMESHLLNSSF